MKVKELHCPKCGSNLIEEEDCFDTYTFSINNGIEGIKEAYCGHCINCGTHLQWNKTYGFLGYEDIEEDD